VRRPGPIAAPLLLLTLAAGCGNEAGTVPEVRVQPDTPRRTLEFPAAGMTVEIPRGGAMLARRNAPGVFRVSLGEPFISAFAYRRKERIPKRKGEVRAAKRRLEKLVEKRDPDFRLRSSRITEVDGAPAVELVGDQTLSRGRLRTRSVHVYKGRAEYVIELLAPVDEFERNETGALEPLLDSIELSGKIEAPKKEKKRDRRGESKAD
jgi:hypothetical protein